MIHTKLTRIMEALPFLYPVWDKERLINARSAGNTCRELRARGLKPRTLIDVGAHHSEWAYWLDLEWPLEIHSIEPQDGPVLGTHHRLALSDRCGKGCFNPGTDGAAMEVIRCPDGPVPIMRFDALGIKVDDGTLIKVDAQDRTFEALSGFGDKLCEAMGVVVELWYDDPTDQVTRIGQLMSEKGFHDLVPVDAGYQNGRIPTIDMLYL